MTLRSLEVAEKFESGSDPEPESYLEKHYRLKIANQLHDFCGRSLSLLFERYLTDGKILDVGCGTGASLAVLQKRGREVRGIDASLRMIDLAKKFLKAVDLDPDSVELKMPSEIPDSSYENIISSDVLEHVENDRELFLHMARALKPNGRLIITVPCHPSLYGPKDKMQGHFRRYTRDQLVKLCEHPDLKIVDVRHWNLVGVLPTFISVRLFKKALNENFRSNEGGVFRFIRSFLNLWFERIENWIPFPVGLTLLIVLEKNRELKPQLSRKFETFIHFGMAGGAAALLYMLSFSLLHHLLIFPDWVSVIVCLFFSKNLNFFMNRHMAFRQLSVHESWGRQYLKYWGATSLGSLINFGVTLMMLRLGSPILSIAPVAAGLGVAAGAGFNFMANLLWVFRRQSQ